MSDTLNAPIVVGVDGSPFSRTALRWAIGEGRRSHSSVVAILVWRTKPVSHPSLAGTAVPPQELPDIRFQQLLDGIVRDEVDLTGGPAPVTRAVPGAAGEILAEASDDARMLVLGSHGHGRLFTALVGSVADYCVRNATCPVVIVPAVATRSVPEPKRAPVLVPDALFPQPFQQ